MVKFIKLSEDCIRCFNLIKNLILPGFYLFIYGLIQSDDIRRQTALDEMTIEGFTILEFYQHRFSLSAMEKG